MRFLTLTAITSLLLVAAASAQTLPVTYADLTPAKQAELVEAWKKNYRSEISALPPGQLPAPAVTREPTAPATPATYQARYHHPADLRAHLLGEPHGIDPKRLEGLSLAELEKLHDEDHDRKAAAVTVPSASSSVSSSSYQSTFTQSTTRTCVGPNCGAGGVQYQQPVAVSQPLILPGFQPFGGKFRPGR
jgi:hypothetical protein